jgi:hypothetical protein
MLLHNRINREELKKRLMDETFSRISVKLKKTEGASQFIAIFLKL